jgi:hypothetical protein
MLNYITLKLEKQELISTTIKFIYQTGPHYAGIKIYNNLPTPIKLLSGNFNQFKKAHKDF